MQKYILISVAILFNFVLSAQTGRTFFSLNGEWEFEQTDKAFPPKKFTRKIPVPGLVHLAKPKIDEYHKFFKRPDGSQMEEQYNFLNRDYTPKYNWYRKTIEISSSESGREAFISIKKSQYVTQIFVNGIDVGSSVECYTPIEFPVTHALKYGQANEILIKTGDRAWLPSHTPGSIDKEKVHYLSGIWDDVELSFTGRLRAHKALMLPSVANKNITAKIMIRSLYPPQMLFADQMFDSCFMQIDVHEQKSNKKIASKKITASVKRDNLTEISTIIPLDDFRCWNPDDPFMYKAIITVYDGKSKSDVKEINFAMRDFGKQGKHFTLNGEKIYLRGSNITLQRFFEDPECSDLAWNKEWVTKLMSELPRRAHWNTMRICVGTVPDFWYDIADQAGIMLQNEWFYWQNHGWNDQTRTEFYNWVWSDGNHPSIVIWDAINENWDDYIGNTLIPELKILDPTRIWDTGYMTGDEMANDEMDEPHPYRALTLMHPKELNDYFEANPYNLGKLDEWSGFEGILNAASPQLVNEYGWIWLWRDGSPSKLTVNNYNFFLGEEATPEQRRELQAYWLQLETEWLRCERSLAGVLAFCHLTNNYGFTGDWFIDNIKDLKPAPVFQWFQHAFSPTAVFINLTDERYTKHIEAHKPGESLIFNLIGINDNKFHTNGNIRLQIFDSKGNSIYSDSMKIKINAFGKTFVPVQLKLPDKEGAYLLTAEYSDETITKPVISRRYLKVGDKNTNFEYYNLKPL
ncbi:MAG: glycoside hydrolase family 2 [Prevotellaceae bacterium]|jgi:hypothetical protein|nr:glycoside hydrolase family 2 [Prevotellaceae bacterium]